jgi:hypothetical protein
VTDVETLLPDNEFIYSRTDPKGVIVEANEAFAAISDSQGNVIQPPQYDAVYFAGDREFIIYELGGKSGLMNAKAVPITEAVYDEIEDSSSYAGYGGLIMAKRGEENWLINSRTGTQEKVPYSKIYASREDAVYWQVEHEGKRGLIDAEGKLLVSLKYTELGQVAEGLLSFRENHGSCGYLDLQGKVVIEAKYSGCRPFGKKGAFVRGENNAETGESGRYGLLDRQGAWVIEPKYAYAYEAGAHISGWGEDVPGISTGNIFSYRHGLFDTDKGVEIIAPKYALVVVLTDKILGFSTAETPKVSVSGQELPAIGLMDYAEKVLLKPEKFTHIALEPSSGKFLLAVAQGKQALIDLDGRQIIAPEWSKLTVNPTLNVIFAYEKWQDPEGGDSVDILRAAYDFNGKPLFVIKKLPCGAEVLQDGDGKTLWPQDTAPYCAQE